MPERKLSVKRLLIFQLKLGLDALRDLILSPVSIIALIIDLVNKNAPQQSEFNKLMNWGFKTDQWINLFDRHDESEQNQATANVDDIISEIENHLRSQKANKESSISFKQRVNDTLKKFKKVDSDEPED